MLAQLTIEVSEAVAAPSLKECLGHYDISQIIDVLGESDVLEVIGIKRCLEYVQAVGFGPVGHDKRFCRERVQELAVNFEYGSQSL
jgi:hypothetical protein